MTHTTKHTPGPWVADGAGLLYAAPSEADEFEVIEINAPYNSQDRQLIAQVHAGFAQSQANAVLIAATPAMYEALREAQELIRSLVAEEMIHSSELQRVGNCQANMWQALSQAEGRHHE